MDLSPELSVSAGTVCSTPWKNIAPGVRKTCQPTLGMEEHPKFELAQARELAEAFADEEIEYLFLGKAGAILLGYPGTTMDVDIFAPKNRENAIKCVRAMRKLGFEIDSNTESALIEGKDFVQIKDGPFDVDIVHAPDGIDSFEEAYQRKLDEGIYPVANLKDIIASKKASNRRKDWLDMDLLEAFAEEYFSRHSKPLKSAIELADEKSD